MASAAEYKAGRWRCGRMHGLHVRNKDSDAWLGQIVFECISASLVKLALLLQRRTQSCPAQLTGCVEVHMHVAAAPLQKSS